MPNKRKRRPTFDAFAAICAIATDCTSLASSSNQGTPSLYIDNGDCDRVCEHCSARFWFDERLRASSSSQPPKYNHCCKGGLVTLNHPQTPPAFLVHLFDQPNFLANIRAYNYMFAMTSFGARIDESINNEPDPYVFKIEGQICHWLGSFCPLPNERPRFLQMYIYDTENEVSNRLHFFAENNCSRLDADIVSKLLDVLNRCNDLVRLFRNARDLCKLSTVPTFSIRLFSSHNSLRYDNPSPNCIGAIVTDPEPDCDGFDIIIRDKVTGPQRISNLHPLYMPLQYPLLFVFGESGWSPELRLHNYRANSKSKKLTMNMFYSYQLHDRMNVYSLLLRGGRLCKESDRIHTAETLSLIHTKPENKARKKHKDFTWFGFGVNPTSTGRN